MSIKIGINHLDHYFSKILFYIYSLKRGERKIFLPTGINIIGESKINYYN